MDDLLKFLLEPLVSDINKVEIKKTQEGQNVAYTLAIPKEDIAKVIGRGGKMIKTIKNLVKIRAIKENVFVSLDAQEIS